MENGEVVTSLAQGWPNSFFPSGQATGKPSGSTPEVSWGPAEGISGLPELAANRCGTTPTPAVSVSRNWLSRVSSLARHSAYLTDFKTLYP